MNFNRYCSLFVIVKSLVKGVLNNLLRYRGQISAKHMDLRAHGVLAHDNIKNASFKHKLM